MAAKEMYDYLSIVAPDNNETLSIKPSKVIEDPFRNQEVREGDDGSEEVVTLDTDVVCYATVLFPKLTASDAGTILDFWLDDTKGNCMAESFKWEHPSDGHTYVVKFRSDVTRTLRYTSFQFPNIKLKVMGKIAD
jgi:hypothetical protein